MPGCSVTNLRCPSPIITHQPWSVSPRGILRNRPIGVPGSWRQSSEKSTSSRTARKDWTLPKYIWNIQEISECHVRVRRQLRAGEFGQFAVGTQSMEVRRDLRVSLENCFCLLGWWECPHLPVRIGGETQHCCHMLPPGHVLPRNNGIIYPGPVGVVGHAMDIAAKKKHTVFVMVMFFHASTSSSKCWWKSHGK